jgi:hypothetical protein
VIENFAEWLQSTAVGMSVGENWFPQIESLHVIALSIVAGTIFIVDFRLLGIASRNLGVTYLSERMLPWTWMAFIGAVVTGSLMFSANATRYLENTPFLFKMGLLVLAGLNMLFFQFVTFRSVRSWDAGRPIPAARAAGALSLLLWTGVIACGRWVGFV